MILDGNTYNILGKNYNPEYRAMRSEHRGITGSVLRIETGVFPRMWSLNLIVTTSEYDLLVASFIKSTPPTNLLSYTDETGITFDPAAGVNTPTHIYNTGVYFSADTYLPPKPMTERGWTIGNRFTVNIKLLLNAAS